MSVVITMSEETYSLFLEYAKKQCAEDIEYYSLNEEELLNYNVCMNEISDRIMALARCELSRRSQETFWERVTEVLEQLKSENAVATA